MNSETRICQNCKQNFTIESEDFDFYKKIDVPPPTWCPGCRTQRRLAFRNNNFLYKKKSDFSGELIFSMIPEESFAKVYELDIWHSDKWDPISYGKDLDFTKPFLSQLYELLNEVPWRARGVVNSENSDYSNNCSYFKNCYLCFNGDYAEDSIYSVGIHYSKMCVDSSNVGNCEICYEGFWNTKCTKIFFSSLCEDSFDIYFSKNLRGCNNCFGCANLRNKSYCIFNKQYTKEEYLNKIKSFDLGSFEIISKTKKEAIDFWNKFPNKFREGMKNTSVSGEYITNSKNVHNSYFIREGEDLKFCQFLQTPPNKDNYDVAFFGGGNELVYESTQMGHGSYKTVGCALCWSNIKDLYYSANCLSCSDCFGCVGLRNKQYCILNKQYSKKEYLSLFSKIIQHMKDMPYKDKLGRIYTYGDYVPIEFSPYPYNETIAQEFFPLTKEQTLSQNYMWRDAPERKYITTKKFSDLPDNIRDVSESILQETLECAHNGNCGHQCTTAFRIIHQEIQFYKQMNLPLPRLCPNCRREERLTQRNSLFLYNRRCQCSGTKSENNIYTNTVKHFHEKNHCPNEFETSYAPDRPEIVYCESCYNSEVV